MRISLSRRNLNNFFSLISQGALPLFQSHPFSSCHAFFFSSKILSPTTKRDAENVSIHKLCFSRGTCFMAHVVCDGCVNCKHTESILMNASTARSAFRSARKPRFSRRKMFLKISRNISRSTRSFPSSGLPSPARSPLLMTGRNGLACRISFST